MKKIGAIIVILILLLLIRGIVLSIHHLVGNTKITADLHMQVKKGKEENLLLKEKLSYVQSNQYIEKEAREKLGLVRNGEVIILAPTPVITPKITLPPERDNWQKWVEVFWNK